MPNPTNTFLWRYLAQQDAQKAQEGEQARYMAEQIGQQQTQKLAQRKQQFAEDEARGATLAALEQPVREVASPATMRGYDTGLAKKKLEQEAFRRALGMKQLAAEADLQGKLLVQDMTGERNRAGIEGRASEGALNRDAAERRARIMAAGMSRRAGATSGRQQEVDTQKLAKDMRVLEQMQPDLDTLRNASSSRTPVGGIGLVQGLVPSKVSPEEWAATRRATDRILMKLLYLQSGVAVSEPEFQRTRSARGLDQFTQEKQWRASVQELMTEVEATKRAIKAGYGPAAIQKLKANGQLLSLMDEPDVGGEPALEDDLDSLGLDW